MSMAVNLCDPSKAQAHPSEDIILFYEDDSHTLLVEENGVVVYLRVDDVIVLPPLPA